MILKALTEYGHVTSEPDAARFGVDVRRFGGFRPLSGAYAYDFSSIASLYAGDPSSASAWRDAIDRTRRHQRPRAEIAAVIRAQQERRGAPQAASDAAAQLDSPDTVAIVTGQQAGAFGGPLYTLLKAVTAIQLARKTVAEHGTPAVAVFWVEAEDHDWNEIQSCTVLDAELQARTITLPAPPGAGESPVAALTFDERVERSIDELRGALAPTDFTESVIGSLRAAYRPARGVADAFAGWLETLLGPHGLIVFESSDPAAKPFVRDLFVRELQTGRTSPLAAAAGERLAALGHEPQVVPQADGISLFRLDGTRTPVRRADAEASAREAAEGPHRFSPNVLLRPIVQDTLFPTICYVAGPSELAYLGQLRAAYEHFGVPMPLMFPRASATLIDSATARFLSRYDVPLADFQARDEAALNRLLHGQLPPEVDQSLKAAGEAIRTAMQQVVEAVPAVDATLAGAAKTTIGKMEHDLRALEGKVIQAAKRRDETLRRQFLRAQAQIFPDGHLQERTLGVVFFLNRYGPALVDRLLEELPLEMGQHWVLTL
jgi:bacillithiol biosynthesis cysteine-adding enzyme BshC